MFYVLLIPSNRHSNRHTRRSPDFWGARSKLKLDAGARAQGRLSEGERGVIRNSSFVIRDSLLGLTF